MVWTHAGAHARNGVSPDLKKQDGSDTGFDTHELRGRHARRNKPVAKGQIAHGSTYVRYAGKSQSWRQKGEGWVAGAGGRGMGRQCLKGTIPTGEDDRSVGRRPRAAAQQCVLDATELQ